MTVTCTIKLLFTAYLTIQAKAKLAIARIVNYNHKVCTKLKRKFMVLNYDRDTFIVEVTGNI